MEKEAWQPTKWWWIGAFCLVPLLTVLISIGGSYWVSGLRTQAAVEQQERHHQENLLWAIHGRVVDDYYRVCTSQVEDLASAETSDICERVLNTLRGATDSLNRGELEEAAAALDEARHDLRMVDVGVWPPPMVDPGLIPDTQY